MDVSNFGVSDWLHYLENAHAQEIQLGLERVKSVATRMDLLSPLPKIITVSGTNGKGSTVAALESIYTTAGYRVAAYTSPHLFVFNERIRVGLQPITDLQLCMAFSVVEAARGQTQLTYFEMTTLAALWYFKQQKLDLIVLEVGMGGRLDATNIIDTDLAIITTVDLDHQAYLGDTKEAIGYEKAGILRPLKPFIYGDNDPPESVIQEASRLASKMIFFGQDYEIKVTPHSFEWLDSIGESVHLPHLSLNPKAVAAACVACKTMQAFLPLTLSNIVNGLQKARIQGRQQVIVGEVTTVFDVAHNPQAAALLANFIQNYQPKAKVHAVFSALKDKDICGLIKPMLSCVDVWYPALLSGKRAASAVLIEQAFRSQHVSVGSCFHHPWAAYQTAAQSAKSGDLIIVFGSFLMVSAVMAQFNMSRGS